ncbi:nitroreductase family deazaflavin-dependent oxidoreductase [Nocardia spumae]|uniref:nitroreductase family deazaflavin-dependent oxidoreductase n=1 Tax=Nocardia spumae TaxID=2887190 RepID=UPI001D14C70A|nr:nitroreductase family deazaflavin-dependent oxidoreductase [Nocardia spumae]
MAQRRRFPAFANPLPALGRSIARRPWVMRAGPLVVLLERLVRLLTRGRHGVLDLAGLPSMELTVLGRRSGVPRTVSLLYVPDGPQRYLLVGSNWGRPEHPSWSANLAAASDAEVHSGGQRVKVRVCRLTGAEREAAWARAVDYWPGYTMEQRLAGPRQFRLFELTAI